MPGFVIRGHRGRYLLLDWRLAGTHDAPKYRKGQVLSRGRLWERDAFYATVFSDRVRAQRYVDAALKGAGEVLEDPALRSLETLGRKAVPPA